MIVAIVVGLIALSVRIASADPVISDDPDGAFDELESSELSEHDVDELIAEAVDELSEDELEELGFDDETIEHGWVMDTARPAGPVSTRSPIGRVDLALVYRHREPIASERHDEVLLLGTWHR